MEHAFGGEFGTSVRITLLELLELEALFGIVTGPEFDSYGNLGLRVVLGRSTEKEEAVTDSR